MCNNISINYYKQLLDSITKPASVSMPKLSVEEESIELRGQFITTSLSFLEYRQKIQIVFVYLG